MISKLCMVQVYIYCLWLSKKLMKKMNTHTCTWAHTHTDTHTRVYKCTHTHAQMHAHTHIHITHTHTDSQTHHTHKCARTHTHTGTHASTSRPAGPTNKTSWLMDKLLWLTDSFPGQPVKKVSSLMGSLRYERRRLARNPLGGSLVILIPFCRTETGNAGEG